MSFVDQARSNGVFNSIVQLLLKKLRSRLIKRTIQRDQAHTKCTFEKRCTQSGWRSSSVLLARMAQYSSSVMRRTNSTLATNLSRNEGRSTQVRRGDNNNNSKKPHKHTRTSVAEIVVATVGPPHPVHRSPFPSSLTDPSLALPGRLQRQVLQIASIHHVHLEQTQQEWWLCGRQEC